MITAHSRFNSECNLGDVLYDHLRTFTSITLRYLTLSSKIIRIVATTSIRFASHLVLICMFHILHFSRFNELVKTK